MIVNYKNNKIFLPDFMIVGAAKSGTSSLFYYLNQHSKVYIPTIKEPWFFHLYGKSNFSHNRLHTTNNLDDYLNLYNNKDASLLGDASTIYLYDYKNVIKNIKSVYGSDFRKIKIIIMLRNPLDRAYSHFLNHLRDSIENNTFDRCFDMSISNELNYYSEYFMYSLYSKQVKAYLDNFNNVKIIISEEFIKTKEDIFHATLKFLNLDAEKINLNVNRNETGIPKNKFIYKFLQNEKSAIKNIIKKIIPYKMGLNIKSKMINSIIYKPDIAKDLSKKINLFFQDDVNELKKILNNNLEYWEK